MKILEVIYKCSLSLFEFIIDVLIIFFSVILLKALFGDNIIVNAASLLIIFCGIIYGIHDAVEVYNENKLNK